VATEAQRAHINALTAELYRYRSGLLYPPEDVRQPQDSRDFSLTEHQAMTLLAGGGTIMFDCSETFAWVLKCAGIWPLSYPGYTGTDLDVCKPHYTNAREALVGAGVVFGPGTGHHVGWVHVPDPKHGNPEIAGHGRPGFDIRTLSDLAAEQAGMGYPGVTFVSIAHL